MYTVRKVRGHDAWMVIEPDGLVRHWYQTKAEAKAYARYKNEGGF